MRGLSAFKSLSAIKENLPAIILRPHGEVNPVGGATLLEDEFIEVALGPISDIQQYPRHPYHMLRAITADIHRATRQVIGALRSSTHPIHLFTPETARDYHRHIAIAIQRAITIPEFLQPVLTDILQILNRHTTRDIPIRRMITRFG